MQPIFIGEEKRAEFCYVLMLITVRNSSCGKVMFSQACVKNSVHSGRGHIWQGGMHHRGHAWQGRMHGREHTWQGACMATEMASAADSIHPTGMYSYLGDGFL